MMIIKFIGKQLARIRKGIIYSAIFLNALNTASLITLAFNVDLIYAILLIPSILFGIFLIGYIMDKTNLNTYDVQKENDMNYKALLTSDIKQYEFQKIITGVLINAIQDKNFNYEEEYEKQFNIFKQKWSI